MTLKFVAKTKNKYFGILIKLFLLSDSAGGHLAGLVYVIIKQPELCKVYNVQPPEIMIREFCYMVEMI